MEYIFLGLGNPPEYRGTRHNIGKDFIEGLVRYTGQPWQNEKQYRIASVPCAQHTIVCAVSNGFMNDIGKDLEVLLRKTSPSRLLVIHDDTHLPVGTIRLSRDRSAGGHNGVMSVITTMGTGDFLRLRVGVGTGKSLKEYVLETPSPDAMGIITNALNTTLPKVLDHLLRDENAKAMQVCNTVSEAQQSVSENSESL